MAAQIRSKAVLWSGAGIGVVGIGALIAVAVTDLGKADQLASVVGAVLAAAGLGLTLWGQFGNGGVTTPAPTAPVVTASGAGSVAAGGNIGSVVTGGSGTSPAPAPAPAAPAPAPAPARPAPGSVTASGDRSVAAGGDIGSVSTGDA
ncbi:hypothetical protein [Streptomyces gardneri]|uniref:hypothetical protein n=1 Tax=Streptomyces gardneri TaxID=66892 RepID=UPI001C3F52B3|nr:hypothetical protein [Streptomyces gardneri]